jgi:hypothetical protein
VIEGCERRSIHEGCLPTPVVISQWLRAARVIPLMHRWSADVVSLLTLSLVLAQSAIAHVCPGSRPPPASPSTSLDEKALIVGAVSMEAFQLPLDCDDPTHYLLPVVPGDV